MSTHIYCTIAIDRYRIGTLSDGGAFTPIYDCGSRDEAIGWVARLNGGYAFTRQRQPQLIPEYVEDGAGGVVISPRPPTPV